MSDQKQVTVPTPLYTKLLTRQERLECIGSGMLLKSAGEGVPADMVKEANLVGAADFGTKAVVALALMTGVPLGIASHLIHNSIKKKKLKEREALQKIDFYQDAGDRIENELAQSGLEL